MTAGEYIKLKRIEAKVSLRQLAYKINMSHSTISDFEKGVIKKQETLQKIVEGLNLSEEGKLEAFKLLNVDIIPNSSKDIYEELKKENENLKEENEKLKEKLSQCQGISNVNNGNVSNQVVGNVSNSKLSQCFGVDFEGLSEAEIKNIKMYVNFVKSQREGK